MTSTASTGSRKTSTAAAVEATTTTTLEQADPSRDLATARREDAETGTAQQAGPEPHQTTVCAGSTTNLVMKPATAKLHAVTLGLMQCSNNNSNSNHRETREGGAGDLLCHPPRGSSRRPTSYHGPSFETEMAGGRWRVCVTRPSYYGATINGTCGYPSASSEWNSNTMLRNDQRKRPTRYSYLQL